MRSAIFGILSMVFAWCAIGRESRARQGFSRQQQIELVVPFPAGGATDVIARMVAQKVSDTLGQPVVVQNRTGATGAIGSEYVARATPNGYTLLVATASTHAVLPAYRLDLPYDTVTSFQAVSLLATFPNLLVVNPDKVPSKTVAEFIAYLKSRPGQLNFASSGLGSSVHFAGELFKLMTKTDMQHVPYRGSAPALVDLLAGNVDLIFDNMTTVWPQVQQGKLRALRRRKSCSEHRLRRRCRRLLKPFPAWRQRPGWVSSVPAGVPAAIVEKLADAFSQALKNPDVTKRLAELGSTPGTERGDGFRTFIRNDRSKWQRVSKEANLSAK